MKKQKNALGSPFKRGFAAVLGNERYQSITVPVFAILLSLLAAAVVLLIMGKNPLTAFASFLQGSGILPKPNYAAKKSMVTDLFSMLNMLTPMIFASLAVAVALKAGLFNIGVSGQMLVSGFAASVLVGYSDLPMGIALPLVLIIGIVGGAAVGALIGWLKHRFNINEVVSSIMLNYIFSYTVSFFINTRFIDPVSRQSRSISSAARLTLTNVELGAIKLDLPLGMLLAIPMAFFVKFLLDKTRVGYEMKVVGLNRRAAEYAGINVGRNIVLSMAISGALAGLAGITFYMGYYNSIQPRVLASLGFDSIAVCLLGNSNPIGILFSSLLITVISKGSNYLSSTANVPQEIAQLITGLILLFSACGTYIRYRVSATKDELRDLKKRAEGIKDEGGDRV
ncbi:MAG: ABC transporter permease [Oscillospiraceae bacterium]|nr:ABC transporter permease [Oscillospiraceae bacterium]